MSSASFDVVMILLALHCLRGPQQVVQALAFLVVLRYINPEIVRPDSASNVLMLAIILTAAVRVYLEVRGPHLRIVAPIWFFSIAAAILSGESSPAVAVSLFKIGMFAVAVPAVLIAFLAQSHEQLSETRNWLASFVVAVAATSAATLFWPSVALQSVPGSFQGIFNHPQAFGLFMAPPVAWAIAAALTTHGEGRAGRASVAIALTVLMLLSLTRTAALAVFIGVMVVCIRVLLGGGSADGQRGRGRAVATIVAGVVSLALAVAFSSNLRSATHDFIYKRGVEHLDDAFYETRGVGIVSQWENFERRPFLGNGFGVFADGVFPTGIVEVWGVPISAPVEKGFAPTVLLEETGVVGAALFAYAMLCLARQAQKNSDPRWVAVFWTAVMVNLGEAVIFSPGGIGLYIWVAIGACVALADTSEEHSKSAELISSPMVGQPKYPNFVR